MVVFFGEKVYGRLPSSPSGMVNNIDGEDGT